MGCVNVADSDAALLEELSLESILAADPDYIFVVLQGSDAADAQQTMGADPSVQSRLEQPAGGAGGQVPPPWSTPCII